MRRRGVQCHTGCTSLLAILGAIVNCDAGTVECENRDGTHDWYFHVSPKGAASCAEVVAKLNADPRTSFNFMCEEGWFWGEVGDYYLGGELDADCNGNAAAMNGLVLADPPIECDHWACTASNRCTVFKEASQDGKLQYLGLLCQFGDEVNCAPLEGLCKQHANALNTILDATSTSAAPDPTT
eukprot:gene24720-24843_t